MSIVKFAWCFECKYYCLCYGPVNEGTQNNAGVKDAVSSPVSILFLLCYSNSLLDCVVLICQLLHVRQFVSSSDFPAISFQHVTDHEKNMQEFQHWSRMGWAWLQDIPWASLGTFHLPMDHSQIKIMLHKYTYKRAPEHKKSQRGGRRTLPSLCNKPSLLECDKSN